MIEQKSQQVMGEDSASIPTPEPQGDDTQQQTAEIPLSIVGGQAVKEGDVIRLRVVSVNTEAGSINVAYEQNPTPAIPKGKGSEAMAEQFNQPKEQPSEKGVM